MMLSDLLPLMTETVRHFHVEARSVHGGQRPATRYSEHPARVVRTIGLVPAPASQSKMTIASATIWLLNHPREIEIGHVFEADGTRSDVVGIEVRHADDGTITKVYLK